MDNEDCCDRLERGLLSEDYADSTAFKELVSQFERDFIIISNRIFQTLGTNVTNEFLVVVERLLNILQWKKIFSSDVLLQTSSAFIQDNDRTRLFERVRERLQIV